MDSEAATSTAMHIRASFDEASPRIASLGEMIAAPLVIGGEPD
jgi:hypothetical protein